MHIVNKDELKINKEHFKKKIVGGSVFVYPTDTIYGIGCNALNEASVQKIRELKCRQDKPFSIIAPSKDWVRANCHVDEKAEAWLDKLPGPYTLILKLKNPNAIAPNVNSGGDSIGVRIPDHWFSKNLSQMRVPIVTTSVNRHGEEFMTSLDNLDAAIMSELEFVIYEDEKNGHPSTIVNLSGESIDHSKDRKVI